MKKGKIIIGTIAAVIGIGLIGSYYLSKAYFSTEASMTKIITSIRKKDTAAFKKLVPTFSNGSALTKNEILDYFSSIDTAKSDRSIKRNLLDTEQFKRIDAQKWFKQTKFLPKSRYITIEKEDDSSEVSIKTANQQLTAKKKRVGPFIPSQYLVTINVEDTLYGQTSEKRKEDLQAKNLTFPFDRDDYFLTNQSFQQKFLTMVDNYYVTLNQSISNDFNFSNLASVSKETIQSIQAEFDEEKTGFYSYTQSFSFIDLNGDSIKSTGGNEPEVTFDIYSDLQTEMIALQSGKTAPGETYVDDSHTATVTVSYSQEDKCWQIDTIDFDTYEQDPKEWTSKQEKKHSAVQTGSWSVNDTNKAV